MIKFYDNDHDFHPVMKKFKTNLEIVDEDTFTISKDIENPCCLNFASHKRPGGGYKSVQYIKGPIKTQEEDLFRRSNLPEIMDTLEIRKLYPIHHVEGFYCRTKVDKDKVLNDVETFEVGVVTVPAVVNPREADEPLIRDKVKRILDIALDNDHDNIVLGAWGCGVFHNDPKHIAELFKEYLTGEYEGKFNRVVFAIPGKNSSNYQIFESIIN
jgi:uncharacterized protein (TIGR02452 family)